MPSTETVTAEPPARHESRIPFPIDGDGLDRVLPEWFARLADEEPEALLVSYLSVGGETREYTRRALMDEALRIAGGLRSRGLQAGDRVYVMLDNHPAFIPIWLGVISAGMVAVPVNTALRGASLEYIVDQADGVWWFVGETYVEIVAEFPSAVGRMCTVPTGYEVSARASIPGAVDYVEFIGGSAPMRLDERSAAPGDIVALMYTSGTTGLPKGAVWSHELIVTMAASMALVMGHRPGDVGFSPLPLFHANALIATFVCSSLTGGRSVIAERFSASRYWTHVKQAGATLGFLLGSMPLMLWNQPPSSADRAHSMRLAIAIPPPVDDFDAFEQRFNIAIGGYYGMSDLGIPLGIPFGERRPGSCGKVIPPWECKIVDDHGVRVAAGVVGELLVRPGSLNAIPQGYWRNPEATQQAWRDLWFHTGDLLKEIDGWYYFIDRKKDAIRRRAENISSFEVETVCQAFPGVLDVAAYGVKAELGEEEVMVCLEVAESFVFQPLDFDAHCRSHLPYFATPRFVRISPQMPRTENAKVQKHLLRAEGVTADTIDLGERQREM